jgi:ribosomal protein S18 acetylase RimI-like enzyme
MDYTLQLKTLLGGERVIGSVQWTDGWQVDGDIRWVMELHAVLPAGVDPVVVAPEDGEDFLFAAWFTIRGSSVWAELVDAAGRSVPAQEAMAEAERRGHARASREAGRSPVMVRPARPAEYEALGELIVAAYRTLPDRDLRASQGYEPILRDVASRAGRSVVLAAELDGGLAGSVTYVPGPGPDSETDDPDAAEIRMLAVAPSARGRGVGRALVEACIQLAREAGRRRLVLHTRAVMDDARHIYESMGFLREPSLDFSVEDIDLLGYVLDLVGGVDGR